jgi:lysophospholipase L1-like esterase
MTLFGWVLVALLALGQPGTPEAPVAQADQPHVLGARAAPDTQEFRGHTYVALGDSISAGKYAVSSNLTFPALVAEQLGMPLELIARSGAKAGWALNRLPEVTAARPALVTVELGTNDAGFRTPAEDFAQQYETIVSSVSQPGTKVLCIGSWLPAPEFDSMIGNICRRHGGKYISLDGYYMIYAFHGADGASTFLGPGDWFHPGDEGHAAIAAAVLAALGAPGPTHQVIPMFAEPSRNPPRAVSY